MISLSNVWKSVPMLALVFMLAACSGTNAPSSSPESSAPSQNTEAPESSPSAGEGEPNPGNEPGEDHEGTSPSATETERPQSESFGLLTPEGNKTLTAQLHQGEGFSLYVFDGFAFDAEKGRLSLEKNADYYADIEPLPEGYNLEELRAAGEKELGAHGEVADYSGELVEHPLGFAALYLQTSGEGGVWDYMVWESETGDAFLFRLHNPKEEEASDFASPVLVSLSTVRSD
ncbi:hypothetical protein [Paenibacillus sp. JJ-223]|uniref:hypothetical protein n=1 Tax=Paenibacillus sp. JJ-223 TaxID=2905647 RepID=UPI001F212B64|nr:hypothetical protein [Paenibacillus sp. JJ-223]CAH1208250.1 hypothetical protein PAECIP111890_03068 [Paenibacillus sp. JJ-223]